MKTHSAIATLTQATWITVALCLSGCLNAEKKSQSKDEITLRNGDVRPTRQEAPVVDDRGGSFIDPGVKEAFATNQVLKNDVQGIGVAVQKVADKMTGIEGGLSAVRGDLAHLEVAFNIEQRIDSKIDTKLEAHFQTVAQLFATLNVNLTQKFEAAFHAMFTTTIAPALNATATAEATLLKKTESWAQNNTAGRDSAVTNFPQQAVEVIVNLTNKFYWTMVAFSTALTGVVSTFAGVIVKLSVDSRRRADARTNALAQLHLGRKLHEN